MKQRDTDYNLKKRFSPNRDLQPRDGLGLCISFNEFIEIDTPAGKVEIHTQAVGYDQVNVKFKCPREFSITRVKYTGERNDNNV